MENGMVERVARGVLERRGDPFPAEGTAPWYDAMFDAKSAIEAMREPTEAMRDSAGRRTGYEETAAAVWDAMIDGALGIEPPAPRSRATPVASADDLPAGWGTP